MRDCITIITINRNNKFMKNLHFVDLIFILLKNQDFNSFLVKIPDVYYRSYIAIYVQQTFNLVLNNVFLINYNQELSY